MNMWDKNGAGIFLVILILGLLLIAYDLNTLINFELGMWGVGFVMSVIGSVFSFSEKAFDALSKPINLSKNP